MRTRAAIYVRFLTMFAILGSLGIAATIYVFIHQRVTLPFAHVYTLNADFSAADGVLGGVGQPVEVVGVPVGQVTGVQLVDGVARVSMQIKAGQLPRVYANASAALSPITALDDMEVALDPGRPPAPPLSSGATIGLTQTNAPVQLSDLLSTLDADSRDYLASLVSSVAQGVGNRGANLRDMLTALGPTVQQVGDITQALAARRTSLARFVHNLALVTRSASQDGQLASVVTAGDETLRAVAAQDTPLRQSLVQLPTTLSAIHTALDDVTPFSDQLGPTLGALSPSIQRLPEDLRGLAAFDAAARPAIRDDVTPLVHDAIPLLRQAGPAVRNLDAATPTLTGAAQGLNYLLNELGYVPGGLDQGYLFYALWAFHNINSTASVADANGSILRATDIAICQGVSESAAAQTLLGAANLCPK
jgi:phospholipid/cholesterol/gamma-HCH transport system substrate-binding protein